jgi:hypothetical protein
MEVCDVAILQKELLVYCSQSTVEKIIEAYLVETEETYKAKKKALETLKEKTIEESNASIKLKAPDEAEKPKPTAESAEKPKPSEDPGKPKTSEEAGKPKLSEEAGNAKQSDSDFARDEEATKNMHEEIKIDESLASLGKTTPAKLDLKTA